LRGDGLNPEIERVEDETSLHAALGAGSWDLVISDYALPGYGGMAALALVRAHDPDLPFILVSGVLVDERAASAMRAGANDYVLKGNLARLGGAVWRELGEVEHRRARRAAEQRLAFLAHHDAASGLPNRLWLTDRSVPSARKRLESPSALVLGLDRLDEVAESFGGDLADSLLQELATRIVAVAGTSTEGPARISEGRLGLLLTLPRERLLIVARAILEAFDEPVGIAGGHIRLGSRIGIATLNGDEPVYAVVRRAELALQDARAGGRRLGWHTPNAERDVEERLLMLGQLQLAHERGELRVEYQPKVNLSDRAVIGVEALMRWDHPRYGAVPPSRFIPLAERAGMVNQLTEWLFETVAAQGESWERAGMLVPIAVNISAHDLPGTTLLELVRRVIPGHWLAGGSFGVEITESAVMADLQRADLTLRELSSLGVSIALDDFGTGYSSLAYLSRLPIDELKIDRSIVQGASRSERDLAILRSMVALAAQLGMRPLAEGIEDRKTLELLIAAGCAQGQGYYFSRPLTPAAFAEWLASQVWETAA
jgi:EAL domain-containing protein (putative c-di-GMP-specific phosphodiesterase class I)/GGDEF domain-containing protein